MPDKRGFSIFEIVITLGLFILLSGSIVWILITSFRSNAVVWEQLRAQQEGRHALTTMVDILRAAETSSIGSFPIESAEDYELVLFANTNSDTLRERVRLFLTSTTLYQGVTAPTGTPFTYEGATEVQTILATDVVNIDEGSPLFLYYDGTYTGTEDPLVTPVDITEIRVVSVQLELESDPTKTPVPLHVQGSAQIRNLKEN